MKVDIVDSDENSPALLQGYGADVALCDIRSESSHGKVENGESRIRNRNTLRSL